MSLKKGATRIAKKGATKVSVTPTRSSQRFGDKSNTHDKSELGAKSSQLALLNRLGGYGFHHFFSLRDSLQRLLSAPLNSLLTISAVAIALVLPSLLFLVLINFQQLSGNIDKEPSFSVYLNKNIASSKIAILLERIDQMPEVLAAQHISADDGLIEFSQKTGLSALLEALDENPLPEVISVSPRGGISSVQVLTSIQEELALLPDVDEVVMDLEWVQRLTSLLSFLKTFVGFVSGLLLLGMFVVVGNTVRLIIEDRRDEIAISQLIGATRAYIRRPFLYMGLCYGWLGACLAALLLIFAKYGLSGSLSVLSESYGAQWAPIGINFGNILLLLICGAVLGWLAAFVSVSRHLSQAAV